MLDVFGSSYILHHLIHTSRQLPDESVCLSVYVSRIQYRSLFRKENGRESFDSENMGVQGLYQEFKERTEFSLNEIVAREGQKQLYFKLRPLYQRYIFGLRSINTKTIIIILVIVRQQHQQQQQQFKREKKSTSIKQRAKHNTNVIIFLQIIVFGRKN